MIRPRFWLTLALLVLPPVAYAPGSSNARADDWPVARGQSREPLPYRYDAAVLKTIPRDVLDDATACVLYAGTTHLVEADGTVEAITHEITRLNSRKGIEKLGEYRYITYDPTHEKLTLNEARIIKANGTIVPIEPRHVQLRDVATDFQVYDQDKQLVISFPNLEVGDVYEVKWTVRGKNREFDGNFFSRYTFGDDSHPVLRDEFRVRVPKGKTLKHATINGKIDCVVTKTDDDTLYHWSVSNKLPLPRDADRPSREELRLQVAVSTFPTWDAVGAWKQKLRKDCWECTDDVRKVVKDVTRDLKTPQEKARALTYWVRRHVRYLSRGPGGLGYTPHQPHQVLHHLYGDCKDQAQLLAVMLKEIGLPVWLVTLGTVDDGQVLPDVPSPWGTHAILLTKIDGKDYWIDTTVSLAAWDFLPRGDRDRQTYITQDDKLTLVKTPAFTYKDYRIEQTTNMTILPDGTTRCKRESTYHHSSAWSKRDRWLEVPPGERRRIFTADLQDAHAKARLLSLKIDDKQLLDFDAPARAEVEFEIPKHFSGDVSREASVTDSPVYSWFLGYNIDMERKLPVKLPTPFESIHRYVVQAPAAYRFDGMPDGKEIKSAWGAFTLKVTPDPADARRLELHMHMRLEKTRVEKSEFADFVQFQDDVSKAYRVWLNVKPTTDLADAPKLEKSIEGPRAEDNHTVKVLAKLYLDNDRAADARRVLDKASAQFPDDRGIWELRVQASNNIDDEDRLYRAMVKQFPSEPRYAVALGAACVRRADHEEAAKILTPLTKHAVSAIRGAAHYQLARSADRQQKAGDALRHLQSALLADSASMATIEALHFKARVHEKLGQLSDAIKTLQGAIEADPSARDALEHLVRLEIKSGQRDAALDHLRRYTVAAEKNAAHLARAADLNLQLGRLDEAFDLASRSRDIDFQTTAQRVLGMVHFARHDHKQAAFHLERADLDGKALAALLSAHVRLGDLDAAGRRLDSIRKLNEKERGLVAVEAIDAAMLIGTRDKLLAAWNPPKELKSAASIVARYVCAERGLADRWPREQVARLIADETAYVPMVAVRGWLALEKGELRKALADAEVVLKKHPNDVRGLLVRGRVRLEQGSVKAALADLTKAVELTKHQDPVALHWLAAGLLDAGRPKDALAKQKLAVLLRPNDAELQEQLKRIEGSKSKVNPAGARQP